MLWQLCYYTNWNNISLSALRISRLSEIRVQATEYPTAPSEDYWCHCIAHSLLIACCYRSTSVVTSVYLFSLNDALQVNGVYLEHIDSAMCSNLIYLQWMQLPNSRSETLFYGTQLMLIGLDGYICIFEMFNFEIKCLGPLIFFNDN
jgi:hypothetical protein